MNLFELFVKIGVDDQASGKLKDLSGKLGNGLKTAAKIGTAAVGAAAAGITALTTAAVNNYAEYEQLVGGIETLFEDLSWDVGQNAAKAFKTAGMSANEYMSTAMSFAASLNQSLTEMDGNIARSADLTDQAIIDMADNANKMGSDLSTLQTAYAGFAKQNYTLLDNLKIGYGGTKEEMQRLIADAAKLSDTVDAQSMSFANIVEAIHVVQTEMGITGTTAKEAASTISGSVSSMKSAWSNLVTGIADENADFEKLIDDFVDSVGITAENIIPRVEKALEGAGKLVEKLVPVIIERIPHIVEDTLPKILQSGVNIIRTILNGISSNPNQIVSTIMSVVNTLIDAIGDLLPEIIVTGSLLLGKLAVGIIQAIPELVSKIPQIIKSVVTGFKSNSSQFSGIGKDIVNGVWNGIQSMISTFTRNVKNFFSSIVNSVKKALGIHSPSRVFAEIGSFMAKGLDKGWEDEFGNVKKDIDNSLSFDDAYTGIGTSVSKGMYGMAYGGTSIGNITINIDGAKYSDEQSLASAIALEIQNMTDRRAAVYA